MRVLEDTVRVVRDVHTEVVAHALVPDLRKVSELDAPVDDVLLELEAQDDVHPVRHLVGLDPDQRRLDAVDACDESVELDTAQLLGIGLLQARVEEAPELWAAPDEVLPQPAL